MDEQPVALAMRRRSPESWGSNLTYGVSPQPAHGPGESNAGGGSMSSALWPRIFLSTAGQTCTQRRQPVQSSGATCSRYDCPLNSGPRYRVDLNVAGASPRRPGSTPLALIAARGQPIPNLLAR